MDNQPLLKIENLAVSFPADRDTGHRVQAVRGIDLSIYPGQNLTVVGESGCGKSVTALSILQLVATPPGRYDAGHIRWAPSNSDPHANLLTLTEKQMCQIRGKQIAMIFQEPMTSLNPVYTIGEQIMEAILLHQNVNRKQAVQIATDALAEVGIADPAARLKEYPHRLSGGMRQRVMIAMALACKPRLLIADEPTTALDVTIQAQILELLRDLQQKKEMAVLLITHDLGVVAENADVVAVMYAGKIVEYGSVTDVFNNPLHPYTRGLFTSMPLLGKRNQRLKTIPGNVPNPANFPTGCAFHPRCTDAVGHQRCSTQEPPLLEVQEKHWVACWLDPTHPNGKPTTPDLAFRLHRNPSSAHHANA
jgi:oligopeptide/dipeptide ABC transporter ATP-binding protein